MTRLGHEVHIITKGELHQQKYEVFKGIHIHRVFKYVPTPYYFPFNSTLLWTNGIRILRRLTVDIIIGHGFESSPFFISGTKKPLIYKAVGTMGLQKRRVSTTWRDILGKFYFPFLGNLESAAIKRANIVIAISNTIKQELVTTYGISEKKIFRIYNGVNIKRFHPNVNYDDLQKKWEFNGKRIILFVGRLSPIKGPQILMEAIPKIIKEYPDCLFLFIGEGPLLSTLRDQAQRLRLTEYVKFLGFISNAEIPRFFALAEICVIPSFYEPFGLVALESLASETPIICSKVGGLAEIQTQLSELPIIDPLKPMILTKEITNLLNNPQRSKQLGKKGRKMIEKYFTWTQCARKTNQLIIKIKETVKKN